MRKHAGPRVWEHRQALILPFTKETLWAKFNESYPDRIKESKYYEVLEEEVWNLKRAYRETCLCKTCENMRLYMQTLNKWKFKQAPTKKDYEENFKECIAASQEIRGKPRAQLTGPNQNKRDRGMAQPEEVQESASTI